MRAVTGNIPCTDYFLHRNISSNSCSLNTFSGRHQMWNLTTTGVFTRVCLGVPSTHSDMVHMYISAKTGKRVVGETAAVSAVTSTGVCRISPRYAHVIWSAAYVPAAEETAVVVRPTIASIARGNMVNALTLIKFNWLKHMTLSCGSNCGSLRRVRITASGPQPLSRGWALWHKLIWFSFLFWIHDI